MGIGTKKANVGGTRACVQQGQSHSFLTDEDEGRNVLAFDVENRPRQQRLLKLIISALGTDFRGKNSWVFQPGNFP